MSKSWNGLYALLLAAGLTFAAQAQTCVPGATADWMVTSDQLAAPIRPAECASVEQSPPDFGWPDSSPDGVYQVTLTYPDGCDHVGDTLREPYVRAIAGLFGRCREKSEMKVAPWTHRLSSPDRKKTRV